MSSNGAPEPALLARARLWNPEGAKPLKTWWIGDPAIDMEASDHEAYLATLEKRHLVVREGATPMEMVLPSMQPHQYAALKGYLMGSAAANEAGRTLDAQGLFAAGVVVAFQLCARFPEAEKAIDWAKPEPVFGMDRLPDRFVQWLEGEMPGLVETAGTKLINDYSLTEREKKALSPGSGPETSSPEPTTAESATSGGCEPTDAQTSDPTPNPTVTSSGSAAEAPTKSATHSTSAQAPT